MLGTRNSKPENRNLKEVQLSQYVLSRLTIVV